MYKGAYTFPYNAVKESINESKIFYTTLSIVYFGVLKIQSGGIKIPVSPISLDIIYDGSII